MIGAAIVKARHDLHSRSLMWCLSPHLCQVSSHGEHATRSHKFCRPSVSLPCNLSPGPKGLMSLSACNWCPSSASFIPSIPSTLASPPRHRLLRKWPQEMEGRLPQTHPLPDGGLQNSTFTHWSLWSSSHKCISRSWTSHNVCGCGDPVRNGSRPLADLSSSVFTELLQD